jgi:hypothetical protein
MKTKLEPLTPGGVISDLRRERKDAVLALAPVLTAGDEDAAERFVAEHGLAEAIEVALRRMREAV